MMNQETESQHQLNERYAFALLPLTVTFGLFTLVGVMGNVFVLLVFTLGKYTKKSNFRVFVICMAIIDLLTCAVLLPAEMVKHRNHFTFESLALCKTKYFVELWAGSAACLCLLIICVDRFMKVVLPLKKQILPYLAVRLCIVFTIVVPVILSVPGTIMCGVVSKNKTNVYNTTTEVSVCIMQPKYEKSIVKLINMFVVFVLFVGMSIVCLIMYSLIGRQIYKHWSIYRKNSYSSEISSDTSGQLQRSETWRNQSASTTSSLLTAANNVQKENGASGTIRPPLLHQGSSIEMDTKRAESQRKKSFETTSCRKMSRQNSGFGIRRFPYKLVIWFVLTLVFIITYLLYIVLSVYINKSAFVNKSPQTFAILTFVYRLHFINNFINPIVYAILDKKFRQASREIIPTMRAWCTRDKI